jgi:hypothetical protein
MNSKSKELGDLLAAMPPWSSKISIGVRSRDVAVTVA